MDVMIEANETLQLQTIREGDIRIDVHMGDITTADFERVPDTVPLGEAAHARTRRRAREIRRPARAIRSVAHQGDPVAGSRGATRRRALRGSGACEPGIPGAVATASRPATRSTRTALSTEAQRMAVLRDFDSVGYRLDGDPEPILTWLPREKNWGLTTSRRTWGCTPPPMVTWSSRCTAVTCAPG